MADKPSDFFLGALDFFGILVPGAVCAAVAIVLFPEQIHSAAALLPLEGGERSVAFAVAAYLLGYLLNVAGAVLDRIWDPLQSRAFERYFGKALVDRTRERMSQSLSPADTGLISPFRWAITNVRASFPVWAADLDRLSAHTALFRSMTVLATLTTLVVLGKRLWISSLLCALLATVCLFMYRMLRWTNLRTVFEYYIALAALPTVSQAQAAKGPRGETAG